MIWYKLTQTLPNQVGLNRIYSSVINRNATQSLVHYILYITHILDNHSHCLTFLTLAYFNVHLQFT